jgi:hypothetical protein
LLLFAVDGTCARHGECRVSSRLGLECEDADYAGAADADSTGRTRGNDSDVAWAVISMNERYCLAIAIEQISGGNIDERDPGRIVLKLNWNGGDVRSAVEYNGHLEGGSRG